MMRVILQYILGVGVLFSCNKYNVDLNNLATENKNLPLNNINHVPFLTQLGNTTLAKEGFDNLGTNYCKSVAVDFEGNVYCAGSTVWGSTSEANGGFSDAFIMKLNSFGVVLWHTQLGSITKASDEDGLGNASHDHCLGIAVDASGNVYCAGETRSSMSEANGGSYDAFVMKLNSDGVVQWHTQLGDVTKVGISNDGWDSCYGVAVDSLGNVYCAGYTSGSMSETNGGSDDAFVMKLNSSGDVVWHTQLGAFTKATDDAEVNNSGSDQCRGVAVDTIGNVYCAGYTSGSMSEVNGGYSDAFVMKLNSDGVVQWHTQLGQNTLAKEDSSNAENDFCWGVAVDISGNVYCAGETYGHLGEINADNTNNADAFVMKLTPNGEILATP